MTNDYIYIKTCSNESMNLSNLKIKLKTNIISSNSCMFEKIKNDVLGGKNE